MSASRFVEVERLYHEAKRRPAGERAGFLDQACGSDDALRKEVESLLSVQTDAGGFLSRSALEEAVRTGPGLREPEPWPTIPGYTVRRVLGEGGMGVVYLAEQETPFRRLVALKLIKPGMDTHQVVARFETERQALALMDHPNIAAVFDAGATKDGRPYFVMEYVEGVCITEYCDDKRLSTRDRLALFVQVCASVQHAHQKGVIHRDLKPSNVLVTERDGHALPKVIDFGTAKAVGSAWSATATQDGLGMVLGTLEYMSPEQAALSADIDTATDVYSLGVLLYELLVGRLPFDTAELRAAGYDEIRRVIRESDPPKPSVRVERRSDKSGAAARARQTDAPGLTRQLRGDLDWITLKALEKDRKRRYATVAAFAADIGRFLGDQPVDARPPSSTYRIRKFTRRHRGAVAAAVSLLVVLVAGLAVSRWQYLRAVDAGARADSARAAAESAIAEANILRLDAEQLRRLIATLEAEQQRRLRTGTEGPMTGLPGMIQFNTVPGTLVMIRQAGKAVQQFVNSKAVPLPEGQYELISSGPAGREWTDPLTVTSGETRTVNVRVVGGIERFEGWALVSGWYQRKAATEGFVIYQNTLSDGRFTFTVRREDRRGNQFTTADKFRVAVGYIDAQNHIMIELDQESFYRYERRNGAIVKGSEKRGAHAIPPGGTTVHFTVQAQSGVLQVTYWDGRSWSSIDSWNLTTADMKSTADTMSKGRFAFALTANEELSIQNFLYYPPPPGPTTSTPTGSGKPTTAILRLEQFAPETRVQLDGQAIGTVGPDGRLSIPVTPRASGTLTFHRPGYEPSAAYPRAFAAGTTVVVTGTDVPMTRRKAATDLGNPAAEVHTMSQDPSAGKVAPRPAAPPRHVTL